MEKLKRIIVLDGDPIASFISQVVFEHVEPNISVIYLTGNTEALVYLQQIFPIDIINPEEGLQLLILGQTLDSLEFLKQLYDCENINFDGFYIVVHIRFFRKEEVEKISKFNVHGYYTELLDDTLIAKIIRDCENYQSNKILAI